jgi:hypothetical protein
MCTFSFTVYPLRIPSLGIRKYTKMLEVSLHWINILITWDIK